METHFIANQEKVEEVTIVSKETHASLGTPYLVYQTKEGNKGSLHPDFAYKARNLAEAEVEKYNKGLKDVSARKRALTKRIEKMRTQARPPESIEKWAVEIVEDEVVFLKKLISEAMPKLSEKEAQKFFVGAHQNYQAMDDAHAYVFQHGGAAFDILVEQLEALTDY